MIKEVREVTDKEFELPTEGNNVADQPAVTKSKKVQATSLSLKPDVRQRLIDLSAACNMSKTDILLILIRL